MHVIGSPLKYHNMNDYDTGKIWRLLFGLVSLFFTFIIISFVGITFHQRIDSFINKPKYSQEELKENALRRERLKRQEENDDWDLIKNGIHIKTGLQADENLQLVIGACTSCHSAKLITQNKATRQGWKSMLVWMQETQGLPDLGAREPKILDYLAKHYAPKEVGRRKNLDMEAIEWYILEIAEE